jgi:hypothetical protein
VERGFLGAIHHTVAGRKKFSSHMHYKWGNGANVQNTCWKIISRKMNAEKGMHRVAVTYLRHPPFKYDEMWKTIKARKTCTYT